MNRRVTVLVPSLCRGGMTRAYVIAGALSRAGARVEIVGALPRGAAVYPEPPPGTVIHPVPEAPFARRVVCTALVATGEVLYAIKPRATSFGVALLCRRGRAVVVDVDDFEAGFDAPARARGSFPRRVRKRWRRARNLDHPRYTRWMEGQLGRADAITANTRFLADRYHATYLPSGRDTAQFDPARFDPEACRRDLGLSGCRVIMFPGTPRSHKGVEDALAALDRLGWPDARLVLVGGREAGDEVIDDLTRRYARWIVRLGRFGVADMPRVVAAAHVIVAPQRDTPVARAQFPMKLTDAMAMAKPIISTRVGDIPAVLDGAAYLAPPSSPEGIAEALASVFADPDEAARRGREARRICEERFSLEALAPIVAAVVERAAAG
jgi:glycosyltransferase involved in cell wall biosynthesis